MPIGIGSDVNDNEGGGELMRVDFNTVLLVVIAIELALIYVKLQRK